MKILHFAAIRLTACLVMGILFGFYSDTGWPIPLILSLFSASVLGILHFSPFNFFRAFPLKRAPLCFRGRAFGSRFPPETQQELPKFSPFGGDGCDEGAARGGKSSNKASIPNANKPPGDQSSPCREDAEETPLERGLPRKERQIQLFSGRPTPLQQTLFGIAVFITVFFTGWLSVTLHKGKNQLNHYADNMHPDTENNISFQIRKVLKPSVFYDRYEVNIFGINHKNASGKILFNIRKDSASSSLKVDDRYATRTQLREVRPPLNPHQFNYKNYLEKRHIYHQIYTSPEMLYKLPDASMPSVYGMAASLRKNINNALKKQGFKGDELAIINALLLGRRQDISEELYNNYTRAGAIHILAVSGLHVGIILFIFNFLLNPLERLKHGKKLKLPLLILLLWAFALVAGLSASVVRAVTMFSFVAWALQLKRTTNIYNILAISMLFLLLIKPNFLFDVGFQLSYSAVFAIVWLQPLLYNRWKPRYKVMDFFWKILTVTLAAQCGVAPLSLYYFHQFPGLFFVSNLVIIPVLGIILGFGVLIIVLAMLRILPVFLTHTYEFIIGLMNDFIYWVAQQEAFLFQDIPFNGILLFTIYFAFISGVLAIKKPIFPRIAYFLIAILTFQGAFIVNSYTAGTTKRFIVFHQHRTTIIGAQQGNVMTLHTADMALPNDKMIKNYKVAERIDVMKQENPKNIYVVREKLLLRIDSLGIYNIPELQPDYVLLCDSPKINLERLIATLKPAAIIANGSNYKSDIRRWKATCEAKKIPFHATGEKGAFIVGD